MDSCTNIILLPDWPALSPPYTIVTIMLLRLRANPVPADRPSYRPSLDMHGRAERGGGGAEAEGAVGRERLSR